ncbi:FKBP-type peptidyl-prolyl cis-trans isomerase N-terminal domain-containing protein [Arenimonas sp.]|uniref:FKBP-type peptidyl-prolyl cis-trans isomerase N-terminal domain-containing protein n=1 Tax=Arenimonas sp. TaxID=1872635 RepID=UPI0039E2DF5B
MKLRSLAVALAALTLSSASALAQTAPAAAPAAAPVADKATLSYALGYDFGDGLSATGTDIDVNTVVRALQDAYAKRPATVSKDKMEAALRQFQDKIVGQQKAAYDKALRENKQKSDVYLASNRSKPGVTTLGGNIQYRVIDAGTGAKPTAASQVEVQLRGTLISGEMFMNTYNSPDGKPAGFKMSEFPPILPAGLKEALMQMQNGARWEITLPPEKAYGNDPRAPGGPGQAVVFDVKLISVK